MLKTRHPHFNFYPSKSVSDVLTAAIETLASHVALITCIDSLRFSSADVVSRVFADVIGHGYASDCGFVVRDWSSMAVILRSPRQFFVPFCEVCFWRKPPPTAFPPAVVLTSDRTEFRPDIPEFRSDQETLIKWFNASQASACMGDGCGLNFATIDESWWTVLNE